MGYTSLNTYKKAIEMIKEGKSDKEIMAELDLNWNQMTEIQRVHTEFISSKEFERQRQQSITDTLLRNEQKNTNP